MTVSAQLTRLLAIGALASATAAMFLISMRGNYLYGYALGQSEEKRTLFAWANVAADVWKAFGLVAIASLWRTHHRRIAFAGSVAWFVCLLSGINSAIGVYIQDRAVFIGVREAQHAGYRSAEHELAEVEQKRARLGSHRSIGEIDALIAAALARVVFVGDRVRGSVGKLSGDCKTTDARWAEVCAEIAGLRSERAVADEAEKLETRARTLRVQTTTLREGGSASQPDPVGEFYAWATRGLLSVRDVGFGFPLFFALMIEIVTAFGPITVVRFAELTATPSSTSKKDTTWPVASRHVEARPVAGFLVERIDERVAAWMSARACPVSGGRAMALQELHDDYQAWCASEQLPTTDAAAFGVAFDRLREMPELSGKIRKFGARYYGIGIRNGRADARS